LADQGLTPQQTVARISRCGKYLRAKIALIDAACGFFHYDSLQEFTENT
jgi:hypothetical protein